MKSKKMLAVVGITMSAALLLAACGKTEKKADAPTTFSYVYAIDPSTLDYSVTSKSSTSDVIANYVKVSNGILLKVKSMPRSKLKTL